MVSFKGILFWFRVGPRTLVISCSKCPCFFRFSLDGGQPSKTNHTRKLQPVALPLLDLFEGGKPFTTNHTQERSAPPIAKLESPRKHPPTRAPIRGVSLIQWSIPNAGGWGQYLGGQPSHLMFHHAHLTWGGLPYFWSSEELQIHRSINQIPNKPLNR